MVEVVESFVEGNKLYVSTKFLENYYNTSTRNIGNWIKKGLPKYKLKGVQSNVFILEEVVQWHLLNINKTKSNSAKGQASDSDNTELAGYEDLSAVEKRQVLRSLPKNSLDEKRVVEDIIEKEYKNKQNEKGWVRKEKPSETIKALAQTFISTLKNLMITISKDGENKTQDELYHLMDKELNEEFKKLQKLLKSEASIDLHQLHRLILDLVYDDVPLNDIIEKIKELNR